MRKIFVTLLLALSTLAQANITVPKGFSGTAGQPYYVDDDGQDYLIDLCMTVNGTGDLLTCASGNPTVILADNISVPKQFSGTSAEPYYTDNAGRIYKVKLCMTSDGAGNVVPCASTSGGSGTPTGTPETLAWFNSSGDLASLSPWAVEPDFGGLTSIVSIPGSDSRTDYHQIRTQTNLGGEITGTARSVWLSLQGDGTNAALNAFQMDINVPVTGDSYVHSLNSSNSIGGNLTLSNIYTNSTVGGQLNGYTLHNDGAVTGSAYLVNVSNSGSITGGLSLYSAYNDGAVTGSAYLVNVSNSGSITGGLSLYSAYNDGAIGTNFFHFNSGNNANVPGDSRGVGIFENNNIDGTTIGFGYYHNGDIGQNAFGFDSNFNSGTVNGSVFVVNNASNAVVTGNYNGLSLSTNGSSLGTGGFGMNWENSAPFTANNATVTGGRFNNQADGYRFVGFSASNSGDMTEESRGFQYTDTGDARTKTALDIQMSGNVTDDAQAIRVNVNNQTSSTQDVKSLQLDGGHVQVSSRMSITSSAGIVIGDRYSTDLDISSPVTGTDAIMLLHQPVLHLLESKAEGPFGVGLAAFGIVPLIESGASGYTPTMRSEIHAASVAAGSGATIDTFIMSEWAGLLPGGGTLSTPTFIMHHDGIGADYCGSTSVGCWFLQAENDSADNYLRKLAVNTSSKKVSTNVRLETHDGHTKYTQTNAPAATPDANAGTGATCTVSGNDSIGEVTLNTGSAAWASGAQCSIAFDLVFNSAPVCVFSPMNDNGAMASLNTWISPTASTLSFNFMNADVAATEYKWSYHCYEK